MKKNGSIKILAAFCAITCYVCLKSAYEMGRNDECDWFLNEADITGPDGKKWKLKMDD